MAAYRTASRLFPGSHIPWLGIGMEYLRTNHLHLALQYIKQAQEICPVEPLVLHELGRGAIARAAAHSNQATALDSTHTPYTLLSTLQASSIT